MNVRTIKIVFGTLIAVGMINAAASAVEKPAAVPVDGKIKWVYDLEAGQRQSRESGKPLFIVFRCER